MTGVICEQAIDAEQLQNQPLRKPKQSLNCGANRPRAGKRKYIWRGEYDAYLKAHYFGGLNRRFRVRNRMIRLTGLPRWYIKRQAARRPATAERTGTPRMQACWWLVARFNLK